MERAKERDGESKRERWREIKREMVRDKYNFLSEKKDFLVVFNAIISLLYLGK